MSPIDKVVPCRSTLFASSSSPGVSPTPPSAVLPLLEYFSILRFRADTAVIRSTLLLSTCRVASLFLVYLRVFFHGLENYGWERRGVNHSPRDNVRLGSTLCSSAFNSRARNLEIDDERRARQPIVGKAKLVQQFERVKLP